MNPYAKFHKDRLIFRRVIAISKHLIVAAAAILTFSFALPDLLRVSRICALDLHVKFS